MFESIRQAYLFLSKGGPIMLPIALSSFVCGALIFERLFALRRKNVVSDKLQFQVDLLLKEGKTADALLLCQADSTSFSRVLSAGLSSLSRPRREVAELLEGAGKREARLLEQNLDFLALLATVSPLLGLLGTVTGMINTFIVVRASGVGDPMKLSGGISEALICTAAGLVVAIPAMVAHRYFLHRADRFIGELETAAEKILPLTAN